MSYERVIYAPGSGERIVLDSRPVAGEYLCDGCRQIITDEARMLTVESSIKQAGQTRRATFHYHTGHGGGLFGLLFALLPELPPVKAQDPKDGPWPGQGNYADEDERPF